MSQSQEEQPEIIFETTKPLANTTDSEQPVASGG